MNVQTLSQLLRLTVPLALLTLMPLVSASAAPFSPITQSGLFTTDDQNVPYSFHLDSTQALYLYTTSYAGGLNADGTTSASEGFDPILTLFDGTGAFLEQNDDNTSAYNRPDAETGAVYDAFINRELAAGDYTLVVTQFDNFAKSQSGLAGDLAQGFTRDGQGNFTSSLDFANGTGPFYDTSSSPGDQNTGNYTFNVASAPPAVPEASTILSLGLLLALGLGGLIVTARKRHATAK